MSDWRKKLYASDWHRLGFGGYLGWELSNKDEVPYFAKLTHIRGKPGSEVESHVLCVAWDDIAEVAFYQRDWTDSGIPFVYKGEKYWSGWWFQTQAERDRFLNWVRKKDPGIEFETA